eukprot:scaffold60930_cov73-Cyclotella_meneghiniana.AAC.1
MSDRHSHIPEFATADENEYTSHKARFMTQISAAMASVMAFVAFQSDESGGGRQPGASTIKRQRKDIEDYIERINDRSFRRRYRMDKNAFWMLLELVSPYLPNTGEERKSGGADLFPPGDYPPS